MNRLWLRSFSMLLCLAQFVAGSQFASADQPPAGDKLVPKDTLFFFSIHDLKDYKQRFQHSSVGQLLQEPQLKPFIDDVTKRLENDLKDLEERIGLSIFNLLDISQGQATFAAFEKPPGRIGVVLVLEYGDRQANVDKLVKEMDEGLEKLGFEHSSEDIDKVSLHTYARKPDGSENPFNTVTYFTDKSTLIVSTETAAIKEVIERWDGNSDDTLADNEQYKYILSQCKVESGEPTVKVFLNPAGFVKSVISVVQTSFPQSGAGLAMPFVSMLGLDSLKGWGGVEDFGDGDIEWINSFFMYAEDSRGLLGIFNFPDSQLAPPKWVPANVASYFTLNWNIQGAYKSIETLVDTFRGPGSTARALDSVAEQGPMIHPKKDLIDHLDGKIHFIQSEPKEAEGEDLAPPSFFVGFGLKDVAKMKKTLAAGAKAAGGSVESRDFNGETIYEVDGAEQTVLFAVTEGTLVFTNEVQFLENVIRGRDGRGLTLVDSPDYKKVAKLFPSKTSMQAFQRSDALVRMYYDLARKVGNDYVQDVDFTKLPPFEVIAKYLTASGSYSVPDKKGMKTVSYSLKRAD